MLSDVSLEIIQKCLNGCVHCSSYSNCASDTILGLNNIKFVIDDFVHLGVKRLCLSGGEPFLHPDLISIVQYASGKGLLTDVYSSGITGKDGDYHPINRATLYECKMAGINRIMFNLPAAHEEIYDEIMQTHHNFGQVIESIKRAQACGIETEIHFVPMKKNKNEIESVVLLADQLGVCQVSFLKLVLHGRAKLYEKEIMLEEEEQKYVQEKLYEIKNKGGKIRIGLPLSYPQNDNRCHAVKGKLYIKFDGSVFGCEAFKYIRFYDEHEQEIIPNRIQDKRVSEIVETSDYLKRSKELIEKYSYRDSGCENCPVQKYLKETKNDV